MKRIAFILGLLLCFLLFFLIGSGVGVKNYPNQEFTRVTEGTKQTAGGAWKWVHKRKTVDADFKQIVKPAVDFLYSTAVLDAKDGPHVLSVPPIDRYFVFQFMEDDTDVYDYVSSRTYGMNKAIDVLIVPNDYAGETHGLPVIKLKTDQTWILARFQLMGEADVSNVHQIQDEVVLQPLSKFLKNSI